MKELCGYALKRTHEHTQRIGLKDVKYNEKTQKHLNITSMNTQSKQAVSMKNREENTARKLVYFWLLLSWWNGGKKGSVW